MKTLPRYKIYIVYFVGFTLAQVSSALFSHWGAEQPMDWPRETLRALVTGFAVAGNFTLFYEWLMSRLSRSEQLKAPRNGAALYNDEVSR